MKCPKCDGQLRVTHTYSLGLKKFQRAVCRKCKVVCRLDTLVAIVLGRGDGAKARALQASKK